MTETIRQKFSDSSLIVPPGSPIKSLGSNRKNVRTSVLLFLLVGCSQSGGDDYFPIMDGLRKEYAVQYRSSDGVENGRSVIRIDGQKTINGKVYFKEVIVFSGLSGFEPVIFYSRKDESGIYMVEEAHMDHPEYLSTRFPLEVGKEWAVSLPWSDKQCRIEAIETAELLDRKYESCLKISFRTVYKNSGFEVEGYSYYCPGVGLVKEHLKGNDGTLMTAEITSHE